MRSALILACAGVLAGCQSTVAFESLPVPEGARTLILFGRDSAYATEVAGDQIGSLIVDDAEAVSAVWFACSMERLGLTPGRIALTAEPAQASPLPTPLAVDQGGAAGWSSRDPEAELAAMFRLPLPPERRCQAVRGKFSAVLPAVRFMRPPAFVITLQDGTGLFADRDGTAARVDKNGVIEQLTVPAETMAAYAAPDGSLWLLASDGHLLHGDLRTGFEAATSSAAFGRPAANAAMAGPRDASDPFELYVSGFGGNGGHRVFLRFDGTRYERLADGYFGNVFLSAVTWIRPKEAVAIGIPGYPPSVTRYRDGQVSGERLPFDLTTPPDVPFIGPSSIRYLPKLDMTVVGRDYGELDRYVGGVWKPMASNPALFFTRTIAPVGHGFIFGFSSEVNFIGYRYAQWFPEIGFCEPEDLTPIATGYMTVLGDGSIAAAMVLSFEAPLEIAILALDEPAERCGK